MAYDKGKSRRRIQEKRPDAEEKKFAYSVEKRITRSITRMLQN